MKVVALVLGICAGLIGLSIAGLGDFAVGLLSLGGMPQSQQAMAKAILWGLPIASLVGAGFAYPSPRIGGILMIGAAAGWLWLGIQFGSGVNFINGAPLVLSGIGGLLSLIASGGPSPDSAFEQSLSEAQSRPIRREPQGPKSDRSELEYEEPPSAVASLRAASMQSRSTEEWDPYDRQPNPWVSPPRSVVTLLALLVLGGAFLAYEYYSGWRLPFVGRAGAPGPLRPNTYPTALQKEAPRVFAALQAIVTPNLQPVDWIYSLQGVSSDVRYIDISGQESYVDVICKPHDCHDNIYAFIAAADGSRAVGMLQSAELSNGGAVALGQPTGYEVAYLRNMINSFSNGVY